MNRLSYIARCATGTCAEITDVPERGGVVLTSTIEENADALLYTYGEFAQFVDDIKAGALDEMHAKAKTEALLTV